jgi:hypothetical protein
MAQYDRPPIESTWIEPESVANDETKPEYPYNNIQQTEGGHSFEMDDTPTRERVRIQHGKSKNFIEMHPNGDQVVKIFGDGYEIVAKNKNVLIKGVCNITVRGDCNMEVLGNFNQSVTGDYNLAVKGQYNVRAVKDISISGDDDVSISANENTGGSVRLGAATSVDISSDLNVYGPATCDSLVATTRVTGGMGVTAGPFGFTSALGGLSLGRPTPASPVALPGSITTVGPIDSLVSVTAPLGNFIIMKSILMTDVVNTTMYNFHQHPAPRGITGFPTLPMI